MGASSSSGEDTGGVHVVVVVIVVSGGQVSNDIIWFQSYLLNSFPNIILSKGDMTSATVIQPSSNNSPVFAQQSSTNDYG